ncbi:MAG: response regulator transcription factor [Acidobacteriota bacterium]|nr:response regulator transcription factor [Acidobacteriota bacterium]
MNAPPVRVILADDHTLVRAGIRRIIESQPGCVVVGEAADGHEAIDALRRVVADVLVLDLKMDGRDGIEVLRVAKAERPQLQVIVLTMHAGREYVARALEEGANGYLLKDSAVQDLAAAIDAVMAGRTYFSPAIQQQMAEILKGRGPASPDLRSLTDREREVLILVARGLATKEIAAALDIGGRTVETHRANLMRKLGVKSVALLTQVAIREGIVDLPAP